MQELDERIPQLTDAQIIVELMRVMALLGREGREGHSGVDVSRVFSHLPLQLYEFPEGIFVVAAAPDHADLIGFRVWAAATLPSFFAPSTRWSHATARPTRRSGVCSSCACRSSCTPSASSRE